MLLADPVVVFGAGAAGEDAWAAAGALEGVAESVVVTEVDTGIDEKVASLSPKTDMVAIEAAITPLIMAPLAMIFFIL
ncbi:hypothetical protein EDD73_11316 [Heliophilum fasciatum]|uniref:Uncharacterized protein n=1 Tax=Heliophilum fasciatum TaxID=35700 RepID=A0A4V6NRN4_9FIRM|nr:hypothetical protein EDD73_11316 [Heliophilum fasciatum]